MELIGSHTFLSHRRDACRCRWHALAFVAFAAAPDCLPKCLASILLLLTLKFLPFFHHLPQFSFPLCVSFSHLFPLFPGRFHGSHSFCVSRCPKQLPHTMVSFSCLSWNDLFDLYRSGPPFHPHSLCSLSFSLACYLLCVGPFVVTFRLLSVGFHVAGGWMLNDLVALHHWLRRAIQ